VAKVIPLDRALRYGVYFLLALIALGGGSWLSGHLIANPSTAMRWVGVVVAVASPLPWLALVLLGIGTWDEFQRHIALVGTAVAFVVECLFYTALHVMQDAGLISPHVYVPYFLATLVIWVAAVGAAAVYYRARP
jgi:hypothetical protein